MRPEDWKQPPEREGAYYIFNIAELTDRVRLLRQMMPEYAKLCYAVKANPFIVRTMVPMADRMEICSPGEWEICHALSVPDDMQVISGVYKSPEFIHRRMRDPNFTGWMTVESEAQLSAIAEAAGRLDRSVPVLLRLTNGSQFGVDAPVARRMIAERKSLRNVEIRGIQFFSGTQKTSPEKLKREIRKLDQFLEDAETTCGWKPVELEYGTGSPVRYFREDALDEEALFAALRESLDGMQHRPEEVILEIGRSAAASCGLYCTHIVDLKRNKRENYALVDGGLHQLTYFGQYMAMKTPDWFVAGKPVKETDDREKWNVCGALCSMNDILLKAVPLPDPAVGDLLCFENAGAYSMTEGMSLFLSRDLPAVYLLEADGTLKLVRDNVETAYLNTPNT